MSIDERLKKLAERMRQRPPLETDRIEHEGGMVYGMLGHRVVWSMDELDFEALCNELETRGT